MKRMLLISHAFHQKTKSIGFLMDLFMQDYILEACYLDPSQGEDVGDSARDITEPVDLVLCIQVVPSQELLRRFARSRWVYVPMFDFSETWGLEQWLPFRNARILSFSKHLTARLVRWGFDVKDVQYFPEPRKVMNWGNEGRVFFWNRVESINLTIVDALLAASTVRSIHVHCSMDPGETFQAPSDALRRRFEISESQWFETRDQFTDLMEACSFYIAPRMKEGIGMSFLEAMAHGRCVIAPDHPTMNEYIIHGENGFLYDPEAPRPLDIRAVRSIQERTLASIEIGRRRWEVDKGNLINWCEGQATPRKGQLWFHLALRVASHPFKATKPWRRWLVSIRFRHGRLKIHLFGRTWLGAGT